MRLATFLPPGSTDPRGGEVRGVFMKLPSSSAPPGGPVRCPEVVKRLDYGVRVLFRDVPRVLLRSRAPYRPAQLAAAG